MFHYGDCNFITEFCELYKVAWIVSLLKQNRCVCLSVTAYLRDIANSGGVVPLFTSALSERTWLIYFKRSSVATKGRSSFVFSNVLHCIAFAGSSKVVESCKMKLRASLICKLGKEVVYIPSFSSLFMREKKWRNCVQTGIRVRWFWNLRRIQESCRRLRFTRRRQFSSWDCFRLYSMEVVKFIIEFYRPWNSHPYSVSPSIFRIASGNLACAPKMYVLIFL